MICDPQIINQNIFEKKSELKIKLLSGFEGILWVFFFGGGCYLVLLQLMSRIERVTWG